jgi:hypothetical protein
MSRKAISALQQYLPIRTRNFAPFTSAHRQFLICAEEETWTVNWLTTRLQQEGWTVANGDC